MADFSIENTNSRNPSPADISVETKHAPQEVASSPGEFSPGAPAKGGEGGGSPDPLSAPAPSEAPPLPPFYGPAVESVGQKCPPFVADGIFFKGPDENPVLVSAKDRGLLRNTPPASPLAA